MDLAIRQETEQDHELVEQVVEKAFADATYSRHDERFLVARLRKSDAFIPELSLVAETDGEIIGHILFTQAVIESGRDKHPCLALAPVSVLPQYQGRGVGSRLITAGLNAARELGFRSVIVLGHADYYPRFGFRPASRWGIRAPFAVPDASFMAIELQSQGLEGVSGILVYAKEFAE